MADEKIPLAEEAPTLVAAGVSEERLQDELTPKAKPAPPAPPVPAHHIQACYKRLLKGDGIEQAALSAGVPLEMAQTVAGEIDACCAKLGHPSPIKKAKADEPVEPKGGQGQGKVVVG